VPLLPPVVGLPPEPLWPPAPLVDPELPAFPPEVPPVSTALPPQLPIAAAASIKHTQETVLTAASPHKS
jgi:hypothetical protein